MADLDGTDVYFDSRDVIARIEELENEREEWLISDRKEYDELVQFRDDCEDIFAEWTDGVTFIAEDDFSTFVEEYAEDIGAVPRGVTWPLNHIDWDAAADELRMDYTEVEFHGTAYLARN